MTQRQILMLAGLIGVLMFTILYLTLSRFTAHEEYKVEEKPVAEIVEIPKKKVVVAATDILSYTIIQENMLKIEEIPESENTANAVTDTKDIVGKPARVDILNGDILTLRKVYRDVEHAGFTGLIPSDCRAVSIAISDITGVSGFINPGDYVDVMLITDVNSNLVSEVILQNVMLLAIDRDATQADTTILSDKNEQASTSIENRNGSPSTATLALHMDEIMQLATAAKRGTIYLVLRPLRPSEEFVDDTYYIDYAPKIQSSEQANSSSAPPTPAFQPPPSPVTDQVPNVVAPQTIGSGKPIEIIQGDQITSKKTK